jgi:ankyrin repeat protein
VLFRLAMPRIEQPVRQLKKQMGSSVPLTPTELGDASFLELIDRGAKDEAIDALKAGQQINVADERGETPVHKATRRGDDKFVLDLLKYGAVADYADVDGVTPIMIAIQFGRIELMQTFMAKGADMHARARDGSTLLHSALYTGHEETVRSLLLEPVIGELLEVKDANGRTPLQVASFRSSKAVCEMLVSAGADYAARDRRGEDCATLAGRSGRRKSKDFFDQLDQLGARHAAAAAANAEAEAHAEAIALGGSAPEVVAR